MLNIVLYVVLQIIADFAPNPKEIILITRYSGYLPFNYCPFMGEILNRSEIVP